MKELILIVTAAGLGTRLKNILKNTESILINHIRLKDKTLLSWSIKPFTL